MGKKFENVLGLLALSYLSKLTEGLRTTAETDSNPVKLEIVPPEDPANVYRQMGQLFRLGVRPELIARLLGVGGKR
ncbi:MAG: hypothetical protein AAB441_05475 [Patescibacteria group bacterium]